jgi:uncharacterized SAM-binding protein YcdF (DUF218 family)
MVRAMSDAVENQAGSAPNSEAPDRPHTEPAAMRRSPVRRLRRAVVVLVAGGALAFILGFVAFARNIADATPPADPRAQGIVVLTGGSFRIDGALQLLAAGRAGRLLISGVNPMVTRQTLAATVAADLGEVLGCCVDLDHRAVDTIGNAAETRRWAEARSFTSLIVVTSAYHMPRSMAELARAMPRIRLIPYPVSNPELHLGDWWRSPYAFALLLREYGKFLLAEARLLLPPPAATESRPS